MLKNFLLYASETPAGEVSVSASTQSPSPEPPPEREPLKILVIGSRRGVVGTIRTLHRLRFAEVGEWSPLLPAPNPGEVMSILTRYILPE
ncbi:MAG: hypothetical protein KME16_17765 [Scytolyngbya sp. HA4215-MV1]|jgi:hypothetical protein|nr:hypothetical protein [Scytolyngbya sp. HA4215-MV1]